MSGRALSYVEAMRCVFQVDGDPRSSWTEDRSDLPLHRGDTVARGPQLYEVVESPTYAADWDSASISANILVKPAPTNHPMR